MKNLQLIPLLYLSSLVAKSTCEFIPTDEWQVVGPDEEIPPGLHVRLDFGTGVKEAKLLSPDDKDDNNMIVVLPQEENENENEKDLPPPSNPDHSHLNQGIDNIKSQLTLQYDLLERMADLAHDIEYGTIIVNSALPELIAIILNPKEHSVEFRDTAARALGASLRNNPSSLNVVFESKQPVVSRLLTGLKVEPDTKIQSRLLYVLSACLDDNRGIEGYIKSNGGDIIRQIFRKQTDKSSLSPESLNIQKKSCDLVQDHIIEENNKHSKWREAELRQWAELFQQTLAKSDVNYNIETKFTIFKTLVSIKEHTPSISVDNDFLSWLATENSSRLKTQKKRSKSDSDYLSIEDQYLEELKRVRHTVFGNPKANRKHFADDL